MASRGQPDGFPRFTIFLPMSFRLPRATGQFTKIRSYDPRTPTPPRKRQRPSGARLGRWRRPYGLPILLTNCSNNYGFISLPKKIVPVLLFLKALAGEPFQSTAMARNVRDCCLSKTTPSRCLTVSKEGQLGRSYNLSAVRMRSEQLNVKMILALLDGRPPPRARPMAI